MEKLKTATWFALRPTFYAHAVALAARKLRPNYDTPDLRKQARTWAAERAVSVEVALTMLGVDGVVEPLPEALLTEAKDRAARSEVKMGGPGDLTLLYSAIRAMGAERVVETGVAYGWSSLAILAAMSDRPKARLVSVDMPYPKMDNEAFVGIVVPERFRSQWMLVREPDRNGLAKALSLVGSAVDLCHYDSDKSWWGRAYAFPRLWEALRPNGLFISDDIQDNMFFSDFVNQKGVEFAVTEAHGKYIGLAKKR